MPSHPATAVRPRHGTWSRHRARVRERSTLSAACMSAYFRAWPRCINMQAEQRSLLQLGLRNDCDEAEALGSRAKYPIWRKAIPMEAAADREP